VFGYLAGTAIFGSSFTLSADVAAAAQVRQIGGNAEQLAPAELSGISTGPQRVALSNAAFDHVGNDFAQVASDAGSMALTTELPAPASAGQTRQGSEAFDSLTSGSAYDRFNSIEALFNSTSLQRPLNGTPNGGVHGDAGGVASSGLARETPFFSAGTTVARSALAASNAPDPQSVALEQSLSASVTQTGSAAGGTAGTAVSTATAANGVGAPASLAQANSAFDNLPLIFEPNVGQTTPAAKFVANGPGYILELTNSSASFVLPNSNAKDASATTITLDFAGSTNSATVVGVDKLSSVINYVDTAHPSLTRTNVPTYAEAVIQNVYPGIDVEFFSNGAHALEYNFIVHPGADPSAIHLQWEGSTGLSTDAQGNLDLHTGPGTLVEQAPAAFQANAGPQQRSIAMSTVLGGNNLVTFRMGAYDKTSDLIIDPVVGFSSYYGGSVNDFALGAAVDNSTGQPRMVFAGSHWTTLASYPTEPYVVKLTPGGTGIAYATYINTGDYEAAASAVAVDSNGDAYMVGDDSVVAPGANYNNGIIYKLDPFGAPLWNYFLSDGPGTRFGVSDISGFTGVALDSSGAAYVSAESSAPAAPNGTVWDFALAVKFTNLGAFVYETNLLKFGDGDTPQGALGVAVDNNGNAFLTGAGANNAYLWEVNSSGALVKATDISAGSIGYGVYVTDVNNVDNIYVTGQTALGSSFHITSNAVQPLFGQDPYGHFGATNAFVAEYDINLNQTYGSYLGGLGDVAGYGIAVDGSGNITVVGQITYNGTEPSPYFPTANPLQSSYPGDANSDGFISQINGASPSTFNYSTYWGGPGPYYFTATGSHGPADQYVKAVALDPSGNVYIAGVTDSPSFPLYNAFQGSLPANYAGFVTEIEN
jgi:hypothetical protein